MSEYLIGFLALLAYWSLHWWVLARFVGPRIWPPRGQAEWLVAVGFPPTAAGVSVAVIWLVNL